MNGVDCSGRLSDPRSGRFPGLLIAPGRWLPVRTSRHVAALTVCSRASPIRPQAHSERVIVLERALRRNLGVMLASASRAHNSSCVVTASFPCVSAITPTTSGALPPATGELPPSRQCLSTIGTNVVGDCRQAGILLHCPRDELSRAGFAAKMPAVMDGNGVVTRQKRDLPERLPAEGGTNGRSG